MNFDYGLITYKHRFTINRSLDDYEVHTLGNVISLSLWRGYKTMAKDKLITEFVIIYRDDEHKTQQLHLDQADWTVIVTYKGDMKIVL